MWSRLKTLDPLLYLLPLILMGISVVMIYTLTNDTAGYGTALRQGIFAGIGLVLMVLATLTDYRNVRNWVPWVYGIGVILLAIVQVKGQTAFGAARWINIGTFQLQPGEIFKAIIILILAAVLGRSTKPIVGRQFFLAILLIAVPALAILLQPDLGTSLVVVATGIGMLLYSRTVRWQKVFIICGVAMVALVITLSFHGVSPFTNVLKGYQKDRLASFVDPSRDKKGTGYNVQQSKIAVGSGGLLGRGLGEGTQSQLNFLPVAHADFIFAGIAEAWGLVGSYGVILLFGVLTARLLIAARIAKDEFGMLICVGIVIKLFFELLVNIGMNIGIMPVTGIPLPFLSYGGTTMVTNALLIGIAQSIVTRHKRLTFER